MSFGRYGKDGKVTHKSSGGNLTALSKKDQDQEKDTDKPIKPKTKTTGSIKNPDDSNTTSGSVKKEILSKINDEDLTNPKALSDNDEQLTNLADDLRQTGDEETADKIVDALRAVEDGSDNDAPAKIDDMMNALKGRPDLNSQYQNELGKMTNLYTDAKYSGKNVNNFVKDTSNIIDKISQLADAGSMDSDEYGTAIRSDAFAEIASTCDALQEKLPNIDGIDKDMKDEIDYELDTIMSMDAENAAEVDVVQVIAKLKYYFKKLSKKKSKKKQVKEEVKENVSIKAYKNAVDPTKKGLMISKSGGMSGTIMIKDKKELKDLETKIAQAKRLYNIKEMKKDDAYAIGMAQAKKSMNDEPPLDKKTITKGHEIAKKILNKEEKRVYVESMAGLRKKADKSGMSYSILKKVFDRGMAAWKTGHRPGASQQQWAYARVNSFITKSSGTWGGADKDLAKQVKG